MRDPERLEQFYEELKQIHKTSFPDLRFMQFMLNFLGWVYATERVDGFYFEEDKTLKLLKEYAKTHSCL